MNIRISGIFLLTLLLSANGLRAGKESFSIYTAAQKKLAACLSWLHATGSTSTPVPVAPAPSTTRKMLVDITLFPVKVAYALARDSIKVFKPLISSGYQAFVVLVSQSDKEQGRCAKIGLTFLVMLSIADATTTIVPMTMDMLAPGSPDLAPFVEMKGYLEYATERCKVSTYHGVNCELVKRKCHRIDITTSAAPYDLCKSDSQWVNLFTGESTEKACIPINKLLQQFKKEGYKELGQLYSEGIPIICDRDAEVSVGFLDLLNLPCTHPLIQQRQLNRCINKKIIHESGLLTPIAKTQLAEKLYDAQVSETYKRCVSLKPDSARYLVCLHLGMPKGIPNTCENIPYYIFKKSPADWLWDEVVNRETVNNEKLLHEVGQCVWSRRIGSNIYVLKGPLPSPKIDINPCSRADEWPLCHQKDIKDSL